MAALSCLPAHQLGRVDGGEPYLNLALLGGQ
jgi:hypothetical protein